MSKKLIVAVLALASAAGCRMCASPCDYSPAVAGSPYNGFNHRAGSAVNGEPLNTTPQVVASPTPPVRPTPMSTPETGLNPPAPLTPIAP
jgi:hypothetical protein